MIEAGMIAIAFCLATPMGGQDGIEAVLAAAAAKDHKAYTAAMRNEDFPCTDLRMERGSPVRVVRVLEAKVDEIQGSTHVCYSHLFENEWRKRFYTFTCLPQPET